MKLEAQYIDETHDEFCIICKQRKGGKFLIIHLPNKKYAAICGGCL